MKLHVVNEKKEYAYDEVFFITDKYILKHD